MALDDDGKAVREVMCGVPFFVARNGGKDVVVVSALGHLYAVAGVKEGKGGGWSYPVFEYHWVPRWVVERKASWARVWLEMLSKLAVDAEEFVDACDFDIEGSVIGYLVLRYACGGMDRVARRMKFSTLTREELRDSFESLLPSLDFALVESGLARHEVDWLYGINLSRALTLAVKDSCGLYTVLSSGRVQGPTLRFISARERSIRIFVPTPFWCVRVKICVEGCVFDLEFDGGLIGTVFEAERIVKSCSVSEGHVVRIESEEFWHSAPVPFDSGLLQSEAYRLFRYTPMRTIKIAQQLYVKALISYPRTSSQKLPSAIGYRAILVKLGKSLLYKKLVQKLLAQSVLKPKEGVKFDSAHPAIYPTGNLPEKVLDVSEKNIYDLIVKRFFAVFGESALKQRVKVIVDINQNLFSMAGYRTLKEGWLEFYKPYVCSNDVLLPLFFEGQKVVVKKAVLKEKFTNPPARYNPSSLLKKMEKEGIGTKATRATTIQMLYDRKYVDGIQNIGVTDLGFEVTEILKSYCPSVVSSEMTKKLEEKMEQIQLHQETRQKVIKETVENLRQVMLSFKEKQLEIGASLGQKVRRSRLEEQTVGICLKCHSGKLVIMRSKKSGKRFVGCSNYFFEKCSASFPLPQKGVIRPLVTLCKFCGHPVVKVVINSKRSWRLCLNTKCPIKNGGKRNEMQNLQ
jgi:DNA topoisomerase-1